MQVLFNRASYAVPQIPAVLANVLGLLLFLLLAAALLWAHVRDHTRVFAAAAAVVPGTDEKTIRWPARNDDRRAEDPTC